MRRPLAHLKVWPADAERAIEKLNAMLAAVEAAGGAADVAIEYAPDARRAIATICEVNPAMLPEIPTRFRSFGWSLPAHSRRVA